MNTKQAREKRIQEIKTEYAGISKSEYKTVKACVEYAMKHHSHVAFARYYLENDWLFEDELFRDEFQYCIEEKEEDQKGWWYSCRLIKPGFFYDPNVTSQMLRTDKKLFSGKSSLAQWKQGDNIPGRETIIQCGFYLGLNANGVNHLLHRAGYEGLYILNGAEAICCFYLNFFYETESELSGFEKLCKVKEKINQYYQNLDYKEKGLLRAWRGKKKEEKDGSYTDSHNPMLLAYDKKLGWNIEEEIRQLQELPCIRQSVLSMDREISPDYTAYLTLCLTQEMNKCKEEQDLDNFLKESQDIFTIKGYGFLWKTWKYIEKVKKYKKNLYVSAVMPESRVRGDLNMFDQNRFFLNSSCEKVYHQLEAGEKPALADVTDALKSILRMQTPHQQGNVKVARGSFNLLDLLLTGRNIALMRYTKSKESGGTSYRYILEDEKIDQAFMYDIGDRNNLIKFCLATGNEDELDHYLELAGFKTLNLAKKYDIQNKTDVLLEYILEYKTALLKKWCDDISKKGWGVSEAQARIELNAKFPTIKLLMLVNQDIEDVMWHVWNPDEPLHEKMVQKNESYLIYPVAPTMEG